MRKKGRAVPEWLNSPIWSAPPPAPAPPDPYGADLAPPLPLKPPPTPVLDTPVPPPPSYEQAVRGRGRGDGEEEGGAGAAALRAHLLADFKAALSKKVVNMGELRRLACLGVPDGGAGVRPVVWKVPTRNLFPFSYAYVFCALSRLGSSPFLNCSAGLLC